MNGLAGSSTGALIVMLISNFAIAIASLRWGVSHLPEGVAYENKSADHLLERNRSVRSAYAETILRSAAAMWSATGV